jgi:uncharacterized metal-binding protein YceD (DUF177 family)
MHSEIAPEFSRIVHLDKVGQNPLFYDISATEKECHDLSERFNIISIRNFHASFKIEKADETGCYHVDGYLNADVTQACVVSLKDVPDHVEMEIHIILRPETHHSFTHEEDIDLTEERDVDFFSNDAIDLGEIAAQYLSLGLNPYPRSETVINSVEEKESTQKKNPFDILKKLKS